MTVSGKRILPVVLGLVLTSTILGSALPNKTASAAQITPRKLILEGIGAVGGSTPGGTVNHHFVFTAPGSTAIQSIKFTYCTQARVALPCTTPTNMDATNATVGTLTGTTGWTKQASSANSYTLTNAAAVDVSAGAEITLDGVKNTTDANTAFYVDITTYTSTDATTGATDDGWVAAATANQIQLSGTMPESLVFCAGSTIGLDTNSLPDCTQANNAVVDFNQLFSPSDTSFATSQLAASTNAGNGYSITVNGPTLTSGSNTISPMDGTTNGPTSVKGTSQFGLNLVVNDSSPYTGAPVITGSADITPASSTSTLRGEPKTDYASNGSFKYIDGDAIADSSHGGAGGTDMQMYTVSYIVNVDGAQQAGTYTTTLSYICTAQF
ncbi:MAG TPA: hypothetical protein VFT49_02885 [Candidatus Saccharimonadales bacterium]|nr:hypothetical protein [Candidatus Saccharimonadales bacterium]